MVEYVLRNNGGLSKARITRHSSSSPLFSDAVPMVQIHAPSLAILDQFLSGSTSVNLAFQLFNTALKFSYLSRSLSLEILKRFRAKKLYPKLFEAVRSGTRR